MPQLETPAIVLSSLRYGETSKIVRLATREHGVQSAIAKGALRPRSRFGASLQSLSEGQARLLVKEHRELHILASFDLTRLHVGLANDLERYATASALAEVMLRFAPADPHPESFDLLLDALGFLEVAPAGELEPLGFRALWLLVSTLGFAPGLDACVHDGTPLPAEGGLAFSTREGGSPVRLVRGHAWRHQTPPRGPHRSDRLARSGCSVARAGPAPRGVSPPASRALRPVPSRGRGGSASARFLAAAALGRGVIIGMAGHIDHGKSTLVTALTGQAMDRLAEERRRGITIELNFAPLDLGLGNLAGVVDVPGHEDFVRTMVAGASGIDLALLVVAADEGMMPQTLEHLAILEHLRVPLGIPVVTKTDLADPEWLAMVSAELAERLASSPVWFSAPVGVSARTGLGLDQLRRRIADCAEGLPPRPPTDLFRLPVDRAFSVAGVGTVVTGTAWSGQVAVGDDVTLLPARYHRACALHRDARAHGRTESSRRHEPPWVSEACPGTASAAAPCSSPRGVHGHRRGRSTWSCPSTARRRGPSSTARGSGCTWAPRK